MILKQAIDFIEKHKIGLHQYSFLECWYYDDIETLKRYTEVIPPYTDRKALLHDVLIEDLITKGLLVPNTNLEAPQYRVGNVFVEHLEDLLLEPQTSVH